jgi:hypothetical protein
VSAHVTNYCIIEAGWYILVHIGGNSSATAVEDQLYKMDTLPLRTGIVQHDRNVGFV